MLQIVAVSLVVMPERREQALRASDRLRALREQLKYAGVHLGPVGDGAGLGPVQRERGGALGLFEQLGKLAR